MFYKELIKMKFILKVHFGGKHTSNKEYGNPSFKIYLTVSSVSI